MPHEDMLTYGTFPLVLAGIVALTSFANIAPFDDFKGEILKTVLNPVWLVKYFAFVLFVSFSGMLIGLLMTWIFKPMADFLGIQVDNQDPEPEPERRETRAERRARRFKRNRRRT